MNKKIRDAIKHYEDELRVCKEHGRDEEVRKYAGYCRRKIQKLKAEKNLD